MSKKKQENVDVFSMDEDLMAMLEQENRAVAVQPASEGEESVEAEGEGQTEADRSLYKDFFDARDNVKKIKAELEIAQNNLDEAESIVQKHLSQKDDESDIYKGQLLYLDRKWDGCAAEGTEKDAMVAVVEKEETAKHLVKKTINPQSFGAWIRKLQADADGRPILPDSLQKVVKLFTRTKVGVKKAPKN